MQVFPALDTFCEWALTHDRVPIWAEYGADLETPVAAFLKLAAAGTPRFLLESVEQGERLGRYSLLGAAPQVRRVAPGEDAWAALRQAMPSRLAPVPGLPFVWGGAVGYWGYDTIADLEPAVLRRADPLGLPAAAFMLTDTVVVFDHLRRTMHLVAALTPGADPAAAYERGRTQLAELAARLRGPLDAQALELHRPGAPLAWTSNMTEAAYCELVGRAQEHILAGDVFQLVGSQRLTARYEGDPFQLYRVLRTLNPSPYMFFMDWGDFQLVGSSPEVMVRLDGRTATLRPIAGTRRREGDDAALAAELLADPKERAEHLMLVDLGRNDLGRVCLPGTVQVKELMTVERYSHVLHLTSEVTGTVGPEVDGLGLLAACFPAGTVTGAPKIRAMQLLSELEPEGRGPYAGAVGVWGYDGSLNTGITIRTMVVQAPWVHVQAGAGIVADSVPAHEYQETLNKAQALLQALQDATPDLRGASAPC